MSISYIERLLNYLDESKVNCIIKGSYLIINMLDNLGYYNWRRTKDVDFACTSENDIKKLCQCIQTFCDNNGFTLTVKRDGERLKNYLVKDEYGNYLFSIDIVLPVYILYEPYMQNMYCVSIYNILVDKLSVLSTYSVIHRVKDIYDIYLIICNNVINIDICYEAFSQRDVYCPHVFTEFRSEYASLENKFDIAEEVGAMCNVNFKIIHNIVGCFIEAFENDMSNLIWNHESLCWEYKNEKDDYK